MRLTHDTEIDEDEGDYGVDFEKAQQYRRDTLEFVSRAVGVGDDALSQPQMNGLINSFGWVGDEVRAMCPAGKTWHRCMRGDQALMK